MEPVIAIDIASTYLWLYFKKIKYPIGDKLIFQRSVACMILTKISFPQAGTPTLDENNIRTTNASPQGRYFGCFVIHHNFLYIFGGTHTHSEELGDFWRVYTKDAHHSLI
jgi:hypothetical protein